MFLDTYSFNKLLRYVKQSNRSLKITNEKDETQGMRRFYATSGKDLKGKGECKEWSGRKTNEKTLKNMEEAIK